MKWYKKAVEKGHFFACFSLGMLYQRGQITPQDLQLAGAYAAYDAVGLSQAREAVERDMIERAIARNRGNLTRCAEELKISRSSLYELIEKLGITRK